MSGYCLGFWLMSSMFLCTGTQEIYLFGVDNQGKVKVLQMNLGNRSYGKHSLKVPEKLASYSDVRAISYDETHGSLLFERQEGGKMVTMNMCKKGKALHQQLFNTSYPVYVEENHSVCWNCKVTSFAIFKNRLYFLLNGQFEKEDQKITKVQLRVLDSCDTCNVTSLRYSWIPFRDPHLFNCSTVIADVVSDVSRREERFLKCGDSLHIENINGKLSFFFQLFKTKHVRLENHHYVNLDLYHVTTSGTVQILHTEKVHRRMAQWAVHGLASVHYRHGVLCWISGDRLYCGRFQNYTLHNTRMFLFPGEIENHKICTGSTPLSPLLLTGINVAHVSTKHTFVFFGCYSQLPNFGGTGLIRMSNSWNGEKQLRAITQSGKRIKLGSLFATPQIPRSCTIVKEDLEICGNFQPDSMAIDLHAGDVIRRPNRSNSIDDLLWNPNYYRREHKYNHIYLDNDTEVIAIDYDILDAKYMLSQQAREALIARGITNTASCLQTNPKTLLVLLFILTTNNYKNRP